MINQKFYPEPYCSLVDTAPTVCYEESILELWAKDGDLDRDAIFSLSQEDIINTINTKNMSEVLLREKNFTSLLGELQYNSTGLFFYSYILQLPNLLALTNVSFRSYCWCCSYKHYSTWKSQLDSIKGIWICW